MADGRKEGRVRESAFRDKPCNLPIKDMANSAAGAFDPDGCHAIVSDPV